MEQISFHSFMPFSHLRVLLRQAQFLFCLLRGFQLYRVNVIILNANLLHHQYQAYGTLITILICQQLNKNIFTLYVNLKWSKRSSIFVHISKSTSWKIFPMRWTKNKNSFNVVWSLQILIRPCSSWSAIIIASMRSNNCFYSSRL